MSGQLVGEVITAVPELKARGISRTAFMALVAIAEKCHAGTRQGSVRWAWIQAGLYGASKRTAQRAVHELTTSGAVTMLSPGAGNRHGSRAPIYRVEPVLDDDTAVSRSTVLDDDTTVTPSSQSDCGPTVLDDDKIVSRGRQNRSRRATDPPLNCGDSALDGPIDGTIDGTTKDITPALKRGTVSKTERGHRLPEDWTPPVDVIEKLAARYPHVDLVDALEEFHDYWRGIPGSRGRKLDWVGTFRNRIRDIAKRRNGHNGHAAESAYERKKRIAREVFDALAPTNTVLELEP